MGAGTTMCRREGVDKFQVSTRCGWMMSMPEHGRWYGIDKLAVAVVVARVVRPDARAFLCIPWGHANCLLPDSDCEGAPCCMQQQHTMTSNINI